MTLLSIQFKDQDKVLSIVKICFKPAKAILVYFLYDWRCLDYYTYYACI